MIYSYNTKRNLDINQEDPKTSTIFELLLCFPDNYLWNIIYNAIMDKRELPKYVGNLCNYIFWPNGIKKEQLILFMLNLICFSDLMRLTL